MSSMTDRINLNPDVARLPMLSERVTAASVADPVTATPGVLAGIAVGGAMIGAAKEGAEMGEAID